MAISNHVQTVLKNPVLWKNCRLQRLLIEHAKKTRLGKIDACFEKKKHRRCFIERLDVIRQSPS